MAYEEKPSSVHYAVTVQIKEVTRTTRRAVGVVATAEDERRVEDVLTLSTRGTSLDTAIGRAIDHLLHYTDEEKA